MKKYKIIIAVIVLFFIVLWGYMVFDVNQRYPQVIYEDKILGESGLFTEQTELVINNAKIYSSEEVGKKYGEAVLNELGTEVNFKCIEVDATIKDVSGMDSVVYLYDLYLENSIYSNGISGELQLLTDTSQLDIDLSANEERDVTLCYILYENQFSDSEWSELSPEKFFIAGEHYPVKTRWWL